MKLILADQSTMQYDYDNGLSDIVAERTTMAEVNSEEARLSRENLQYVQILADGDSPVATYENLVLEGTDTRPIYGADGETVNGYELHIHLREKTAVEVLTERVDALEESQATQDGAIDDLGGTVSELMEG